MMEIAIGVAVAFALRELTRGLAVVASERELHARAALSQYAFASLERALGGKAQLAVDGALRVQVDGLFLHVRLVDAHTQRSHFRCVLGLLPGDVGMRAESVAVQAGGRRVGPEDLATGDAVFDRMVWVEGPEPDTAARLDAPTRAAIRALVAQGGVLEGGQWTVAAPGPRGEGDVRFAGLERTARLLLVAGRAFLASKPAHEGLTALALHDPIPEVRARALLRLFRKPWSAVAPFPEVARRVAGRDLVAALASPLPDVVVAAALLLRLEGTAMAVPALRSAASRMAASPERDALKQAVLAIQARVGSAQGALSVASEDGALSVAEDGGQVSVARREGPTAAPPRRP